MRCPKPIVEISKRMRGLPAGDTLEVEADDPAFRADVEAWVSVGSAAVVEWGQGEKAERVLLVKNQVA